MSILKIFPANWPAPESICALTTTKEDGYSEYAYASNNLALHVGDLEEHVLKNRSDLRKKLSLPNEPIWLEQTHSSDCVLVDNDDNRCADAAITQQKGIPLAIMTADCLPIILCNKEGSEIAAIHSGWRGLVNGVVENTLLKMQSQPERLMAWIGPAICGQCYEIGEEVKKAYVQRYPVTANSFITRNDRYLANLPKMAELILKELGIDEVYQSNACTYELENTFYSYRREAKTGRIATLIWIK